LHRHIVCSARRAHGPTLRNRRQWNRASVPAHRVVAVTGKVPLRLHQAQEITAKALKVIMVRSPKCCRTCMPVPKRVPVKHGVYAEAVVCCANVLRDSRYSQQIFSHIALLWTCCKVQVQLAVGCWPALLAACTLQCAPKRALYQTGCIDPCLISSSSIVY
jgi:hypothetical protein